MDLWVRSQDRKELIKINHLVLMGEEIRGVIDNGHYIMLGIYKTKERALEVLDEIEKFVGNEITIPSGSYHEMDLRIKSYLCTCLNKFYVMPKE